MEILCTEKIFLGSKSSTCYAWTKILIVYRSETDLKYMWCIMSYDEISLEGNKFFLRKTLKCKNLILQYRYFNTAIQVVILF